METRLEEQDDEMSEILRRALRKESGQSGELRERLLAVADEIGISHEAVFEAEDEYRADLSRKKEINLYKNESRLALKRHCGLFAIVNVFLVGLNFATYLDDKEIWIQYVFLGWGIALAIHAFISSRNVNWEDREFQEWRTKRLEK